MAKHTTKQDEGKEKANFNLKTETIKKLKYVAFQDDIFQSDVVDLALIDYFAKWEKKNGEIKLK